jgi:hypothetical protein
MVDRTFTQRAIMWRHYVRYVLSGGGSGGCVQAAGLTNGRSTIDISKTQPACSTSRDNPVERESEKRIARMSATPTQRNTLIAPTSTG